MNCKNCQHPLEENAHFCDHCGAKVIKDRITFRELVVLFITDIFGIDSRFFRTLKEMAIHPDKVLNEYLNGVRKRYMNPFGFLAVAAGVSLLVFNYFADDFIAINKAATSVQMEQYEKDAQIDITKMKDLSEKEKKVLEAKKKLAETQLKINKGMLQFMLRYLNLLTFVLLFILAVLSKWTFWKPYNYGEHLIINAYLYGLLTYSSIVLFLLSIVISPSIYFYSTLLYIIFYMYAFGKFFKLTLWQNIVRLLKFLVGFIVVAIILMIILGVVLFLISFQDITDSVS